MIRRLLLRTSPVSAAARHFCTNTNSTPLLPEKGTAIISNSNRNSSNGETLARRLFSLTYAKRSAVVTIRKWKEEGNPVRKYEINRIVRQLRRLKRHKHALEVCEWMQIQQDIKLVPGDYAMHLDLIAKIRGLNSAEKFFTDLPENMRDAATCSALLHTYVQHKESDKAEALMKKMAECEFLKSPLPYNHMLSLYLSSKQFRKIPDTIQELRKNTSPDVVTYNIWLSACAAQNFLEVAEKVFLELTKSKNEPDWLTYSTMTSIYIKNSLPEKAEATLKEMEKMISKKVRVGYPSLMSLHTGLENKNEVLRIWKKMKSIYRKLNDAEYTCMLTSLLKLNEIKEAEKLYNEWESISPTKDSRVPNLLLANYINENKMEMAEAFYDRMGKNAIIPGYTTWVLLTWGNLKRREVGKALDCFEAGVTILNKWDPDEKLVGEVCGVIEELADIDAAERLLVILRKVGYLNTEIYKSVLRAYAKAGQMPVIMAERMKKDNVKIDEETESLLQSTSKLCVGEIPSAVLTG